MRSVDRFPARTAVSLLTDELTDAGWLGQGRNWTLRGGEVVWHLVLDQAPGHRTLGLELTAELENHGGDGLRVFFEIEDRGSLSRTQMIQALDLDSSLDTAERSRVLHQIGLEVTQYVSRLLSVDQLRSEYRSGLLDSAFIGRLTRVLLESD